MAEEQQNQEQEKENNKPQSPYGGGIQGDPNKTPDPNPPVKVVNVAPAITPDQVVGLNEEPAQAPVLPTIKLQDIKLPKIQNKTLQGHLKAIEAKMIATEKLMKDVVKLQNLQIVTEKELFERRTELYQNTFEEYLLDRTIDFGDDGYGDDDDGDCTCVSLPRFPKFPIIPTGVDLKNKVKTKDTASTDAGAANEKNKTAGKGKQKAPALPKKTSTPAETPDSVPAKPKKGEPAKTQPGRVEDPEKLAPAEDPAPIRRQKPIHAPKPKSPVITEPTVPQASNNVIPLKRQKVPVAPGAGTGPVAQLEAQPKTSVSGLPEKGTDIESFREQLMRKYPDMGSGGGNGIDPKNKFRAPGLPDKPGSNKSGGGNKPPKILNRVVSFLQGFNPFNIDTSNPWIKTEKGQQIMKYVRWLQNPWIGRLLGPAFIGLDVFNRTGKGQTSVQAISGALASAAGGWAGFTAGANLTLPLSGPAMLAPEPISTGLGALLYLGGGMLGAFLGADAAGKFADYITGVRKKEPTKEEVGSGAPTSVADQSGGLGMRDLPTINKASGGISNLELFNTDSRRYFDSMSSSASNSITKGSLKNITKKLAPQNNYQNITKRYKGKSSYSQGGIVAQYRNSFAKNRPQKSSGGSGMTRMAPKTVILKLKQASKSGVKSNPLRLSSSNRSTTTTPRSAMYQGSPTIVMMPVQNVDMSTYSNMQITGGSTKLEKAQTEMKSGATKTPTIVPLPPDYISLPGDAAGMNRGSGGEGGMQVSSTKDLPSGVNSPTTLFTRRKFYGEK